MHTKPTIYLGADHAGFALKEKLKEWLKEWGYDFEDKGAYSLEMEDDYNDFVVPVAQNVAENPRDRRGIVLGGSGQGEAMAANRFKGVRAAVYYGGLEEILRFSREHNDANVLSLGARFVDEARLKDELALWLKTSFLNEEKYLRRINKMDK